MFGITLWSPWKKICISDQGQALHQNFDLYLLVNPRDDFTESFPFNGWGRFCYFYSIDEDLEVRKIVNKFSKFAQPISGRFRTPNTDIWPQSKCTDWDDSVLIIALFQWFSGRDILVPPLHPSPRAFSNFCRQFCCLYWSRGCYWHLVNRGQRRCSKLYNAQNSLYPLPPRRNYSVPNVNGAEVEEPYFIFITWLTAWHIVRLLYVFVELNRPTEHVFIFVHLYTYKLMWMYLLLHKHF